MLGQAFTLPQYQSRESSRRSHMGRQSPSPRASPLRSFLLPCQPAGAFSPHPFPSFQRSSTYSPSNPFCRRRLVPISVSPARRLDYAETPYGAEIRWIRDMARELMDWIADKREYDTLVNICFWAALVVFISTIYGIGTSTYTSSVGQETERVMFKGLKWRDEYQNHLDDIWGADTFL